MFSLNPTEIAINTSHLINTSPLLTLPIKKRADGKGYALIPNELISMFHFTKNQKIEATLITNTFQSW